MNEHASGSTPSHDSTPTGSAWPDKNPTKQLRCPHCHNPIAQPDTHRDEVRCPGCGSAIRVANPDPRHAAELSFAVERAVAERQIELHVVQDEARVAVREVARDQQIDELRVDAHEIRLVSEGADEVLEHAVTTTQRQDAALETEVPHAHRERVGAR